MPTTVFFFHRIQSFKHIRGAKLGKMQNDQVSNIFSLTDKLNLMRKILRSSSSLLKINKVIQKQG